MRLRNLVVCLLAGGALLACVAAVPAADVPHWKVWLCSPNVAKDWCNINLSTTIVYSSGSGTVFTVGTPVTRPVDCFYVYPTVSRQKRGNADLRIQIEEKLAATSQAAQFERVCRVFAPMYRQVPVNGAKYHPNYNLEYQDVLAAWRDYLAHDNNGRGVVLIGHAEGAVVLKRLIKEQVEKKKSELRLLVSAILLGADVTVADGSDVGGDFTSVPACRKATQAGCVIAYSSWSRIPPKNAAFQEAGPGKHVLCVNPGAIGGKVGPITPLFPWFHADGLLTDPPAQTPRVIFMAFPGLYFAECIRLGSRAWLNIHRITYPSDDPRPSVREVLNPSWGLRAADLNVALLDLVTIAQTQGKAWIAHH